MLIININCQNITHNHKWLPYYTHLVIDQVNITLAPHVGNMHICHQFLADMACRCDTEESTTCPIYENGFRSCWWYVWMPALCWWRHGPIPLSLFSSRKVFWRMSGKKILAGGPLKSGHCMAHSLMSSTCKHVRAWTDRRQDNENSFTQAFGGDVGACECRGECLPGPPPLLDH